MKQVILLLSLLSLSAHADFKQINNSEFEFISTMVSKNLKDCLAKEAVKEVGLSILNKTSQHIDKDAVALNF